MQRSRTDTTESEAYIADTRGAYEATNSPLSNAELLSLTGLQVFHDKTVHSDEHVETRVADWADGHGDLFQQEIQTSDDDPAMEQESPKETVSKPPDAPPEEETPPPEVLCKCSLTCHDIFKKELPPLKCAIVVRTYKMWRADGSGEYEWTVDYNELVGQLKFGDTGERIAWQVKTDSPWIDLKSHGPAQRPLPGGGLAKISVGPWNL